MAHYRFHRWLVACLTLLLLALSPLSGLARKQDLSYVLKLGDRAKAHLPQRTLRRAVHQFGLKEVALSQSFVKRHNSHYKYEVPGAGPKGETCIRDQQYSGNCWIFATGRVLTSKLRRSGRPTPQLSASFVNYHTLREAGRAVLREAARSNRRTPNLANVENVDEGGYQVWAMDMIKRHGFVPESKMPLTADAADPGVYTNRLQALVTRAKRDFARLDASTPEGKKLKRARLKLYDQQLDELLHTTIGKPPKRFTVGGKKYTPKSYAKALGLTKDKTEYVTLTHYPNRAWNRRYVTTYEGLKPIEEYNVSMDVIQNAVKKTIRHKEAVLFGTNVSEDHPNRANVKHDPRAKGILSMKAFKYRNLIPETRLSKRDRLNAGISEANHAMAITGYDPGKKPGSVRKWKVQNSHGAESGDKGLLHMYDDFFRQNVEDVVVPRWAVPKSVLRKLESKPILKNE